MPQCITCDWFNGEGCDRIGFHAACPEIHLECRGYTHTTKMIVLKIMMTIANIEIFPAILFQEIGVT
jgi:hypothetical protein